MNSPSVAESRTAGANGSYLVARSDRDKFIIIKRALADKLTVAYSFLYRDLWFKSSTVIISQLFDTLKVLLT